MSKPKSPPSDKIELYDKLIASFDYIDRKGKTMPYTSLNGHMFSFLDKDGKMGLRFSKVDLEFFNKKNGVGLNIQYNSVMRGYAVIPNELMENTNALIPYIKMSYEYIKTLKPKLTKKK